MINNISYISAFLFGFFGSVHCVGMCGSIVSILTIGISKHKLKNIFLYQLLYNLGRIISYCIAGFLAGIFGVVFFNFFSDNALRFIKIIFFALMIMFGVYTFFSFNFNFFEKINYLNFTILNKLAKKFLFLPSPYKDFFLGLLWGNMPCGFVYSALCFSIISGSVFKGVFLMFFFGLGTLPAMMLTSFVYLRINVVNKSNFFRKVFGILTIFFGAYLLITVFNNESCHFLQ